MTTINFDLSKPVDLNADEIMLTALGQTIALLTAMGNLPASLYCPPDLMTALSFVEHLLAVKLQSGNIRVLVGCMRDIQSAI